MTAEAAGARPVTITSAEVTIRVVSVADKPMTIAVFEQLPTGVWAPGVGLCIGYINRHPRACDDADHHYHVLTAVDHEPSLLTAYMDPSHTENHLERVIQGRQPRIWDSETGTWLDDTSVVELYRKLVDRRRAFVRDVLPGLPQLYVAR